MRLFGFPIARYIDINDLEEGLRATQGRTKRISLDRPGCCR